jgi:hypothetical protein
MVVCVFGVCRAGDDLSQRAQDGDAVNCLVTVQDAHACVQMKVYEDVNMNMTVPQTCH